MPAPGGPPQKLSPSAGQRHHEGPGQRGLTPVRCRYPAGSACHDATLPAAPALALQRGRSGLRDGNLSLTFVGGWGAYVKLQDACR